MIFLNKGDAPVSEADVQAGTQRHIDLDWPSWKRERSIRTDPTALNAYMDTVSTDTDTNRANNTFNWQLQDYRKAVTRLAQYRLADGRPEIVEQLPTGEYDEEGNEFVESVLVQSAVEPLVATVEQTTYDMDGVATVATVANPLIVADDEERAAAQAVVDGTPVGVVDF
jgi:hypothetical protein